MSSDKPENQPAFPSRNEDGAGGFIQHPGMTLRDWFAGKALEGMLPTAHAGTVEGVINNVVPACAKLAYVFADAMLAAREGKQ
jgi:hypothetical protein